MSSNQSLRNWAVIIVLLVVFALVTAVFTTAISNAPTPSLELGGEAAPSVPQPELEHIDFEIKPIQWTMKFPTLFGINLGGFDITVFPGIAIPDINPLVAIGVLFALVIGGIAVFGGAIATPILLGSRLVESTKESQEYKESVATLEAEEKQTLKQMNEGRTTLDPDHDRPGWSAVATALIILMFAYFLARVLDGTFFPEGIYLAEEGARLIRTTPLFVTGTLVVTLLGIAAWISPRSVTLPEGADFKGIPWDTIAVIMTGLVVVGLGIGAMVWVLGSTGAG